MRCYNNICRLATNPESASCSPLTSQEQQAINLSCDQTCSSNNECSVNLRCYANKCRLATNPTSTTCSPPSEIVSTPANSTYQTVNVETYNYTKGGLRVDTPKESVAITPENSASATNSLGQAATPTPLPLVKDDYRPTESLEDTDQTKTQEKINIPNQKPSSGFPWWLLLLVAITAAGLSYLFLTNKKGKNQKNTNLEKTHSPSGGKQSPHKAHKTLSLEEIKNTPDNFRVKSKNQSSTQTSKEKSSKAKVKSELDQALDEILKKNKS